MFLKNCWYVAAWDYELIDGKLLARTLLNERVLLYRGDSGEVIALNDRCPHRGALLSHGRREGDGVRCMYHGIKYDQTGRCVDPRPEYDSPKLWVLQCPSSSAHSLDLMGDPARAIARLFQYAPLRPEVEGLPAYLRDSNYLLIVDSLKVTLRISPSCTPTLSGSEEYAYVTKPVVVERQERGFRVSAGT
jgi:vanillate O-demethylase monooxygenase subunit